MSLKFLCAFSLLSFLSFSQDYQIQGQLVDKDTEEPLEYASVSLLQSSDSTVVRGAITDFEGIFDLKASVGKFILRVDYLGYERFFKTIEIQSADLKLGKLLIAPDGETLEEVNIVTAKELFKTEIDKRTYDVENNILSQGATATELLSTLPSIQMDEEGNISMRGSGNVLIYINGRPTNMSSEEMESVLSQFPSNSIKSVELITNPSSKYDSQGVGGIINLVLKKDERLGMNGQINASVGTRDKYQGGFNLNYGAGKVNLYTSYNYQYRSLFQKSQSLRQTSLQGFSPNLDQDFDTQADNQSHLFRTGMDYNVNGKVTLGVYGQYNRSSRDRIRVYNQRNLDANFQLDSLYQRTLNEDQASENIEVGTTATIELDSLGQNIYASFSYANNSQRRVESFDQLFFDENRIEDPSKFQDQIYGRPQKNDLLVAQIDYTLPLNEEATLETGLKSTLSYNQPEQFFDQLDLDAQNYVRNDTITNAYPFDEEIHGAYGIFRSNYGKLGLQLGGRVEWTTNEGTDANTQITYSNNYVDFFPSAYLTYDLNKEGQEFIVNYSRRINRPSWGQFAPFYNAQDLLNTRFGNPELRPEYTNSYEVGFNTKLDWVRINSTVYHRSTTDAMTRIIGLLDNNAAVQLWENVDYRRDTGFEVINQLDIMSNLDATFTGNLFYSKVNARNLEDDFFNSNFSWTLNLLANWIIPEVASVQLMADYRGPIILPQGRIDPIYGVNLGIRKNVFNDRATISLNISDIFNTRVFNINTRDAQFTQERFFNSETRIATIAFNYRFGGFFQKETVKEEKYPDDPF